MVDEVMSRAETALENQRFGGLQFRVALLCSLVQALDGYDIGAIGMAVPSLTHAWNVPGAAFSITFIMSSVGILVGALASGPTADSILSPERHGPLAVLRTRSPGPTVAR